MSLTSNIKDAVHWFSNAKILRGPLVTVMNCNQQLHPSQQVWAIAAAFNIVCEAYGLDSHDMINKIENARKSLREYNNNEWDAMVNFVRGEHSSDDY